MSIGSRSTPSHDNGWSLVSLRAAKSIASSEAIHSSNGQLREQIKIIAPPVLEQLYSDTKDNLFSINNRTQNLSLAMRRQSEDGASRSSNVSADLAEADSSDTEQEANLLAMQTLRKLFESAEAGASQVNYASHTVIRFILARPTNESWATSMIDLMAQWTPVQSRFAILRSLLEVLASLSRDDLKQKLVVTRLISSLLSSSVNLAGLSVLDVLHVLFGQILGLIERAPAGGLAADPERQSLVNNLALATGDLASHVYYSNQIADMVTEVLVNMRPAASGVVEHSTSNGSDHHSRSSTANISSDTPESPSTVNSYTNLEKFLSRTKDYNASDKDAIVVGLRTVKEIIQIANSIETGVKRNVVPLHAWDRTEWALTDSSRAVQYAYVDALLAYFKFEAASDTSGTFSLGKHVSSTSGFLAKLHLAVYDYALQESNIEEDYRIINAVLLTLLDTLGNFGILYGLPMVLQLQDTIYGQKSGLPGNKEHLRSRNLMYLDSIILTYISAVATKLGAESLAKHVDADIAKAKTSEHWQYAITNPPKALAANKILSEKQVIDEKNAASPKKMEIDVESSDGDDSEVLSNNKTGHVDRNAVVDAIVDVDLPDHVKQEFVGPWNRELVLQESKFILIYICACVCVQRLLLINRKYRIGSESAVDCR